ncbi:hypothetical protein DYB28_011831, partial [Aphanomyces astaci]
MLVVLLEEPPSDHHRNVLALARDDDDEVSILAEPTRSKRHRVAAKKSSGWSQLCQRLSTSAEVSYYALLAQLLHKEHARLDPRQSRVLTQNVLSLPPPPTRPPSSSSYHHQPMEEASSVVVSSYSSSAPSAPPSRPSVDLPPLPPLDFSPSKHRKRPRSMSLSSYETWTLDFPSIRPGMSVRVVRAERTASNAVAHYVMHVVDLHTKVMWECRKRFRELYAFRREIKSMCRNSPYGEELTYLFEHLAFPKRSVVGQTSGARILRRRLVLE